jgi:hypothetical protein
MQSLLKTEAKLSSETSADFKELHHITLRIPEDETFRCICVYLMLLIISRTKRLSFVAEM